MSSLQKIPDIWTQPSAAAFVSKKKKKKSLNSLHCVSWDIRNEGSRQQLVQTGNVLGLHGIIGIVNYLNVGKKYAQ